MYGRRYNYNYRRPNNYYRRSYRDFLEDFYRNRYRRTSHRLYYGADEPESEEVNKKFHVIETHFEVKNIAKLHNTDRYQCTRNKEKPILVVRRGEPFEMHIKFDRPYKNDQNQINFRFHIGKQPLPAKYTEDKVVMEENSNITKKLPRKWFVKLTRNDEKNKSITVEITPPYQCIIGNWKMEIETESKLHEEGDTLKLVYKKELDFYVLFNPYCPEDSVYMSTTDLLDEYIQCQAGILFIGNANQPGTRAWNHGQFYGKDGFMLKICLDVIMKAFQGTVNPAMADPIRVARVISRMVNSSDGDNGILVGNWSGNYEGGKAPWSWNGSVDILKKYEENGQKPVKYGQCWVFSGLTTTLCRCIGIPCRSVTNFQSAHDTDGSTTIDKIYMKKGTNVEFLEEYSKDSVWNFHVWNEVWMTRPDIKEGGCDGWQVIDATPQETSEDIFRCGPCPVSAIKKGDITKNYDAPFIFAEVNSDKISWLFDDDTGEWEITECDPHVVGQKISTKIPDGKAYTTDNDRSSTEYARWHVRKYREDITHTYKFPEGTLEERIACGNADKTSRDVFFTHEDRDVSADIRIEDGLQIGSDFQFTVVVKNVKRKRAERTIKHMHITVDSHYYTGSRKENIIKKDMDDFELGFQEEKEFVVKVTKDEYWGKMAEYFDMVIRVYANIDGRTTGTETFQKYLNKTLDYRLRRPDIHIKTKEHVKVGQTFEAKFGFGNPLHVPLTNCKLHVSGSGIKDISSNESDVPANSNFIRQFDLEAEDEEININATFECDELADITGSISLVATE